VTIPKIGKEPNIVACGWIGTTYKKREVHLSMPRYIEKALTRFKHAKATKLQYQPHKHAIPVYGATVQYAKEADTSQLLNKNGKQYIQQVVGTFLFYGRAVDGTMLPALSAIASSQVAPTQETMEKIELFLDYAASHPDAIVTYRASHMVLALHIDASILSEPKARSRAGGHFFLSKERGRSSKQWGCIQHSTYHQGRHIISSRS